MVLQLAATGGGVTRPNRWLNESRDRVVTTMAAGKGVYCETLSPHYPAPFVIYRQPPPIVRWVAGPRMWARALPLATLTPVATEFGTWISDQPWQTPHQRQRLGAATYRFVTRSGHASPPLRVGNNLVFVEEHGSGAQFDLAAGAQVEPSTPVLNVSLGANANHAVTFSGEVFGITDPRVVPRLVVGSDLYDAVVTDLRLWTSQLDVPLEDRDLNEESLLWINEIPPQLEATFSASVLDVPEGAARLLQGRVLLPVDGPFAFAIELVDEENNEVLAASDPVAGMAESMQVISRFP